jgi:mannosyltransferase OCH1-like enzyme
MAPGYSYRFLDDAACHEYIRVNFSESVLKSFERLQVGAAKADFWRVLAVLKEGGVYMDLDAALCWPPSYFFRKGETELLLRMGDGRLTNYCFAAAAGHPLLQKISAQIQCNISANSLDNVFEMTGPGVFQQFDGKEPLNVVSSRYVCRQGQFTNKYLQYPKRLDMYWVNQQREMKILNESAGNVGGKVE